VSERPRPVRPADCAATPQAASQATYQAVVFDLDGTIVDSVELIIVSFQHAMREVLGKEVSREESIAYVGRPLREQMVIFCPERADELVTSYREFNHREHDRMLSLYEGILPLLDRLQKAGVKLGLVTSKSRPTTQMAFDLTGIEHYFGSTICSDESPGNKPSPDPILLCLEQLQVSPVDAAYVGDSPADIQAALAAGVEAIGVTWGVFDADTLAAERPDILVDTIAELAEVLGIEH
jgi:pyrophosphatase PpaX